MTFKLVIYCLNDTALKVTVAEAILVSIVYLAASHHPPSVYWRQTEYGSPLISATNTENN